MPVQAPFGMSTYPDGMDYSLDQVRAFIAVAEERHFGRAAERLAMTQPPLSRSIQKLERAVGATLLDRDSRGVRVTGAGEAFLLDCHRMVALVDSASDAARRVDRGVAGVLRLGFTAVSAIGLLGPLLARIEEELPDVHVELREGVTSAQVEGCAGVNWTSGSRGRPSTPVGSRPGCSSGSRCTPSCPSGTDSRSTRVRWSPGTSTASRSSPTTRCAPATSRS